MKRLNLSWYNLCVCGGEWIDWMVFDIISCVSIFVCVWQKVKDLIFFDVIIIFFCVCVSEWRILNLSWYNQFIFVFVCVSKSESLNLSLIKSVYFCVCVAEWKDWFFVDIISHCWVSEIWLRLCWFWGLMERLWFLQSGILCCILVTFGNLCFSVLALYSCSSIYIQLKKFSFHFFVCVCGVYVCGGWGREWKDWI